MNEFCLSKKREEVFVCFNIPESFREIIEKQDKEFIRRLKIKKAWIQGNVIKIGFKKPTYQSAFFDTEEVFVISKKDLNELLGDKLNE